MNLSQKIDKKKHRRSVSRRLDENQSSAGHQTISFKQNNANFDIQHFVQKSTQKSHSQTVIVDQLIDENTPPSISHKNDTQKNIQDGNILRKLPFTIENIPNKQSEYFFHWNDEQNFTCLSKLKNYFSYDEKIQINKSKLFRQKFKNKLFQINAEYQIGNGLGPIKKKKVEQVYLNKKIRKRQDIYEFKNI